MIAFEKYLLSNGYEPFHFNCKKMQYEKGWLNLSTMTNLDNRWFPKGIEPNSKSYLNKCFVIGLGECGLPPHVLYPYCNQIHKLQVEMNGFELINHLNTFRIKP